MCLMARLYQTLDIWNQFMLELKLKINFIKEMNKSKEKKDFLMKDRLDEHAKVWGSRSHFFGVQSNSLFFYDD